MLYAEDACIVVRRVANFANVFQEIISNYDGYWMQSGHRESNNLVGAQKSS